ncbi:MAG: hypothetical protein C4329_07165 [Chitinophagaceae bacterium]
MKLILVSLISLVSVVLTTCPKKKINCFKGKLVDKGACVNYTISVIEGNIDTSLIVPQWTNEANGKTYHNVFALGSRCSFPADINEGDEFYFTLDAAPQNCAVCMIYYPTPPKKLSIKASKTACP